MGLEEGERWRIVEGLRKEEERWEEEEVVSLREYREREVEEEEEEGCEYMSFQEAEAAVEETAIGE